MRHPVFWPISILLSVGLVLISHSAQAYCILHTCRNVEEQDLVTRPDLELKTCQEVEGCIAEGHALFYDSSCLSFGVSALNAGRLGLTPEEFHDIIADAFAVWETVDCGGGRPPGLDIQSAGVVDADGNFFCEELPRANLSVWSLAARWERPGNALGYTSSTHNTQNGEVFDADVEINVNKVRNEHAPENWATVLSRIAVHEAGHTLGLAHSQNPDAVMYESYSASELYTRVLAQDDVDGICDLYPPDDDIRCSAPGYVEAALGEAACFEAAKAATTTSGCTLAPPSGSDSKSAPWLVLVLAGLVGAWRRTFRSRVAVSLRIADTRA